MIVCEYSAAVPGQAPSPSPRACLEPATKGAYELFCHTDRACDIPNVQVQEKRENKRLSAVFNVLNSPILAGTETFQWTL